MSLIRPQGNNRVRKTAKIELLLNGDVLNELRNLGLTLDGKTPVYIMYDEAGLFYIDTKPFTLEQAEKENLSLEK